MPKFLLWDNDGVLVDTERWHYIATRDALADSGIVLSERAYLGLRTEGRSAWTLAAERGMSPDEIAERRSARNRVYQAYLERADLTIPGVHETLEVLAASYRMGIVTTSRRDHFDTIHRTRPYLAFFEFALTIEDFRVSKPAPDGYLAALRRFGASPEDAVVIEDSEWGLEAACRADLRCVVVRSPFTTGDRLDGAWHVVDSIRELPALLGAGAGA